jgi:hypothetical protein
MDRMTAPPPNKAGHKGYQIGVSRPPLEVADLPTPEEVFGLREIGTAETVQFVLGPSLIALGIAIGSGEWLLGPLNVGRLGFIGIGWVILVSALLQTFYNIEFGRYMIATGEVPVVGFARVPPGAFLWVPFSLVTLFFALIWGGWAKAAAQALFALLYARVPSDADSGIVEFLAVLLLLGVFVIAVASRRVTRGLELFNGVAILIELILLFTICLLVVPIGVWWDGIRGLITPALPPAGSDATLIGGLAGFTALASGLNWYALGHYRDKGYGMGHRVGFISGLRGERSAVRSSGLIFPEDEKNIALWHRWMGYLKLDTWLIFFGGSMVGMFLPIILMRQMVLLSGQQPTQANVSTFSANVLGQEYGRWVFYFTLLIGFLILYKAQISIFEALVRNMTDALNMSSRFQRTIAGDPRRFYYPFMVVLTAVVAVFLHFFQPARLVLISANMSNFGALIFPFVIIYLNSRLPRPARPSPRIYLLLLANFLFFGFFFLNFVVNEATGHPLVTF